MIWFAPDPNQDLKDFMHGLPSDYGNYDEGTSFTDPAYCDVPADENGVNRKLFDKVVTTRIPDPPSDKELGRLPESDRRVTQAQHTAAMRVRLAIADYEDVWEQATNPGPFLALLSALNHSLRYFVTGNFYYAARAIYQAGYDTFRGGWPPEPLVTVQIPNNLRQVLVNLNNMLLQAIQSFHATLTL